MNAIHTSNRRLFDATWIRLGGTIEHVRRTGEERYFHPHFTHGVTTNSRRKDVPAKMFSRLNQVSKQNAANDPVYVTKIATKPSRNS